MPPVSRYSVCVMPMVEMMNWLHTCTRVLRPPLRNAVHCRLLRGAIDNHHAKTIWPCKHNKHSFNAQHLHHTSGRTMTPSCFSYTPSRHLLQHSSRSLPRRTRLRRPAVPDASAGGGEEQRITSRAKGVQPETISDADALLLSLEGQASVGAQQHHTCTTQNCPPLRDARRGQTTL